MQVKNKNLKVDVGCKVGLEKEVQQLHEVSPC